MSAKILSSMSEENRDFHKQYGCMNGIFQLFDRVSTNNKRFLHVPGAEDGKQSKTASGDVMVRELFTESNTATAKVTEKNVKIVKDEPRISIESPRKSSSSSTFPLPDVLKTEESRSTMINHLDHPTTQVPKKKTSSFIDSNNQTNELQNSVKNSIQKEHSSSGLTVKIAVKEKGGGSHVMKHVDSPRPLPLSKPSYSRITGFDASPRALTKIQESPRNSMEQIRRKDLPRFSLDGRETQDVNKSVTKLKDFPRLSLDSSRESSLSESRLNLLRDRDNITIGAKPSNVVVKLMGLEAFPDSNLNHLSHDQEFQTCSTQKTNKTKESRIPPSLRNDGTLIEPFSPSKFPIEQAPWKQPTKKAQKSLNVYRETKITSSVYGEMEERLSELEFTKYGKDLRALKQILEAMQKTRNRSDDEQDEQSESEPQTARSSTSCNQLSKASSSRRNRSNKKDPIKIDSPKAISKKLNPLDTSHVLKFKNETPKNNTFKDTSQCRSLTYKKNMNNALKPVQTSRSSLKAENHTPFDRNSSALSPRFQVNNQRTQKQSLAATQPNEAGNTRKNHNRKLTESDNSTRKTCSNQHRSKSKRSEIRSFTTHLDDSSSLQSDSNSSASQIENEVTSTGSSTEITPKQHIQSKERQIAARLYEDKPMVELTVATERPSPISVLDATFCLEDSPSPVKKISISFQDFETSDSDKAELHHLNISSSISRSGQHDEFDKTEPEHTKHLIYSTAFQSWDLYGNHIGNFATSKMDQKIHRRMLFDTVNEIILRKTASESPLKRIKTEQELLKEIFLEIENLQAKTECDLDDLDGLGNILTADLKRQPDDWENMQSEIPAMVLDIERLIFKDLITEVLNRESLGLHDIPGKQRKLFL